jgi:hypothetical protein
MAEPSSAIEFIQKQIAELNGLTRHAGNAELANQALQMWHGRVSKLLKQSIGREVSEKFEGLSTNKLYNNPSTQFHEYHLLYKTHLDLLIKEIQDYPEVYLDAKEAHQRPAKPIGKIGAEPMEPRRVPNHTIFIDVKSYSGKTDEEQIEIVRDLTAIVSQLLAINGLTLNKDCYALPTGDGMALCLIGSIPEKCAHLAISIVRGVIDNKKFQIRMGINFAYDFQYTDINGRTNIAGVGINVAARIESAAKDKPNMILVSSTVAEHLNASREFRSRLRAVGERSTKDRTLANIHELLVEETQTATDSIKFEQKAEVVKISAPKPLCKIVGAHFHIFNNVVKINVMIVDENSSSVGHDSILDILILENKHYVDDIRRSKVDCSFSKSEKGDNIFTLTGEYPRTFARVPENEDTIYLRLVSLNLVKHLDAPCDDRLVPARVTFQHVSI